jgi:coiled-coil domain-containing protein 130
MVVSLPVRDAESALKLRYSGTCNNHIGMGVRYNAEKRKVGNYYSTPIYAFRCKCHLCDGWFEIRTDPKVRFYALEKAQ